MIIIAFLLIVLGVFCSVALFSPSLRTRAKPPLTRRTYLLAAVWFFFGAALMFQMHHTNFSRPSEYGRLQWSRGIAAALSVLAIGSYGWDIIHACRRLCHPGRTR
jgi:hypothetical protein